MFKKPILDATMKALKTERDKAQKELDGIASMEQKKAELTEAVAALDESIKPIKQGLDEIQAEEDMKAEQAEAAKKAEADKAKKEADKAAKAKAKKEAAKETAGPGLQD